jgi:hypothetical protein
MTNNNNLLLKTPVHPSSKKSSSQCYDRILDALLFVTSFMYESSSIISEFARARYPSSQEEREKLAQIIINEKALRFCEVAETRLKKNGGIYLVGKSVSLPLDFIQPCVQ